LGYAAGVMGYGIWHGCQIGIFAIEAKSNSFICRRQTISAEISIQHIQINTHMNARITECLKEPIGCTVENGKHIATRDSLQPLKTPGGSCL